MLYRKALIGSLVFATLTGCNTLKEINSSLAAVNDAMGSVTGSSSGSSSRTRVKHLSSEKLKELDLMVSNAKKEKEMERAFLEAKSNMYAGLSIDACNEKRNAIQKYSASGSSLHYNSTPYSSMRYHNSSRCVDVVRVHGWEMKAKNAFSFEGVFESSISGEVKKMRYSMIKQPTGEWLFY